MRSSGLFALLWCLALASASCVMQMPPEATTPAETQPGEVAIRLTSGAGAVLVPVRINGQGPFDLILDTGATVTCVDTDLSGKLDLPARSGVIGRGVGVDTEGSVSMVTIETLEVGSASAHDVMACTLDLQHLREVGVDAQGLLGLNVLRMFEVTIDFERQALRLDRQ